MCSGEEQVPCRGQESEVSKHLKNRSGNQKGFCFPALVMCCSCPLTFLFPSLARRRISSPHSLSWKHVIQWHSYILFTSNQRVGCSPCRDGTFPIEPASTGSVPGSTQSQKEADFFSGRFSETTEDAWKPPKNRPPHEMFTIQDVGKLVRSEGCARCQPLRARSVREVLGTVRFSLKSYLRQPYGPAPRAEFNLGLPQDLTPAALFPCSGFGKPGLEQDVICSCWSA